ncbi:MAG: PorT family protein [Bacteroidales bacterium]|nr:PorT family protein [Bacteroidales bacterium]
MGLYNNIIRTVVLTAAVLLTVNTAKAQLFRGAVSAGAVISQLDGDEVYGFKHVGFTGGLGVMMPFNPEKADDGFQLSLELLFTQRGAKNSNIYDPFWYKADLNYIDIPLMVHYMDKRAGVALGVGLQYGRLIKTTERWKPWDTMILDMCRPVVTNNHSFDKNDLSFVADFRFNVWKKLKFDVRWQYSLIPIRKDFEYFNSFSETALEYKHWTRDFKSNYVTFKFIYVINEPAYNASKYSKRRR